MTAAQEFVAGLLFVGMTLWFLWKMFDSERPVTELRLNVTRFVCSASAGFSGVFMSGAALLAADAGGSDGTVRFQLAAGVVLFFVVFLSLGRRPAAQASEPSVSLSIGTDMRFDFVAEWLAKEADASVDLSQLMDDEREQVLMSTELRTGSLPAAQRALAELARLVPQGSVRPYKVTLDEAKRRFVLVI